MKKNFVKKLALGLALVMAVTSVPATSEAAAKPGFKSSKITVKEGQTKKYSTENSSKYSVKFKIGNKAIATIKYSAGSKSVKVTGVAEGKTTLRADFKSYKTKEVTTARIPVTVKAVVKETAIQSVTQDTITKLTANFVGDTSAVKASDITVVRTDDNAVVAIKSVTVDGAKVVIETYTTMADGENYTVTYNSKSSVTFKATDATVSNVNVTPLVVTAAQATKVEVQTLDAAGVVLGNYTMTTAGSNNLEFTLETNDGYVDGDKLYLTEVGKTAKAKVVYHTWKYDDNGNEIGKVEREFVITAVKDATVISNFKYTIAKNPPAWESTSFKANTSISASDKDMKVFFNIKDSKDEQVDYTAYKVASSDTSKLIVEETSLTDSEKGIDLVGVSAGTAYILLQNADGNTVKTFPVTVLADRKASVLTLDTSAVVVSNATAAADKKEIGIAVKDQYGVKLPFDDVEPTFEVLSAPKGVDKDTVVEPIFALDGTTDGKLTVSGTDNRTKGTYVFKVNVAMGDVVVSRTLTVNVQEPKSEDAASYALVINGLDANNKVDLAVKTNATTASAIELDFKVATKDASGVLNGYVGTKVDYTVKHSSGKKLTVTTGSSIASTTLTTVDEGAVVVPETVKTGTYTVTAEFTVKDAKGKDVDKKITKTFTVEDTQVAPTIIIKDTDANKADIKTALEPSETVIYYYDGVKYDGQKDGITVVKVTGRTVDKAGKVFVQYVTIKFPVNGDVSRVITIPVNKTFTNVTADAE